MPVVRHADEEPAVEAAVAAADGAVAGVEVEHDVQDALRVGQFLAAIGHPPFDPTLEVDHAATDTRFVGCCMIDFGFRGADLQE